LKRRGGEFWTEMGEFIGISEATGDAQAIVNHWITDLAEGGVLRSAGLRRSMQFVNCFVGCHIVLVVSNFYGEYYTHW